MLDNTYTSCLHAHGIYEQEWIPEHVAPKGNAWPTYSGVSEGRFLHAMSPLF